MPAPKGHPPYNKNGEGGRPKIYTKEFADKEAAILEEWMQDKNNLFIGDFTFERGYTIRELTDFKRISERFDRTYEKFKDRQMTELFKGGLRRKFAHPMCALILSHSHGVYLKQEQRVTGDNTNPLAFIIQEVDGLTKDLVNE